MVFMSADCYSDLRKVKAGSVIISPRETLGKETFSVSEFEAVLCALHFQTDKGSGSQLRREASGKMMLLLEADLLFQQGNQHPLRSPGQVSQRPASPMGNIGFTQRRIYEMSKPRTECLRIIKVSMIFQHAMMLTTACSSVSQSACTPKPLMFPTLSTSQLS